MSCPSNCWENANVGFGAVARIPPARKSDDAPESNASRRDDVASRTVLLGQEFTEGVATLTGAKAEADPARRMRAAITFMMSTVFQSINWEILLMSKMSS